MKGIAQKGPRQRGRPVSKSVDRALSEAALKDFLKRGYHGMSMESVAARAGVSKVSLYRRWNSKLALTAEVFRMLRDNEPVPNQGSLESDIRYLIERSTSSEVAGSMARIVMRTLGEISGNRKLLDLYREHLLMPRMEQLRGLIERARKRGELRPRLSTDVACSLVAGPIFTYYLAVLAGDGLSPPKDFVSQLTDAIHAAIGR